MARPISTRAAIAAIFLANLTNLARGQSLAGNGDCTCLTADYLQNQNQSELALANFKATVGESIDLKQYGAGCFAHDIDSLECSDASDCTLTVPLPLDCDKSYCKRSWCYVDPTNCARLHYPSVFFDNRHYSYAACGELDSFTFTERLRSLKGRVFQVGYVSNTGGWKGAFNPSGSFAINKQWTGPAVDFVHQTALEGGFAINMTEPPEWLRNNSRAFFGNSNFDLCVYAVSLGYLDFCVGSFTINEKRSSVTTMFEIASDPIYLIAHTDRSSTDWESFSESAITIFKPFAVSSWIMIFIIILPLLGMIMFFHEDGAPGSAYPKNEPVLVERKYGRGRTTTEVVNRPISKVEHVVNSIYMATLSFFQGSYEQSVVSVGGKIHLLAIASFIMLILAVYTANLAAILTQNANKVSVDSIETAVKQDLTICAERKVASLVVESYGIDENNLVPDPVELGGDGQPGFNCPNCKARERVFNNMRRTHDDPSQYCNVALASQEDLDIMHRYGNHCDKMKVGESLTYISYGIPIHDGEYADALVASLHKEKADGVMSKSLAAAAPVSRCPETGGEGTALDVKQLTGVWVITFSFVLLALLAKLISRRRNSRDRSRREGRLLHGYDQWGNTPPHDMVVGGYRYDTESNGVRESRVSIPEERPLNQGAQQPHCIELNANNTCSAVTPAHGYDQCGNSPPYNMVVAKENIVIQEVNGGETEERYPRWGVQQPYCLETSANKTCPTETQARNSSMLKETAIYASSTAVVNDALVEQIDHLADENGQLSSKYQQQEQDSETSKSFLEASMNNLTQDLELSQKMYNEASVAIKTLQLEHRNLCVTFAKQGKKLNSQMKSLVHSLHSSLVSLEDTGSIIVSVLVEEEDDIKKPINEMELEEGLSLIQDIQSENDTLHESIEQAIQLASDMNDKMATFEKKHESTVEEYEARLEQLTDKWDEMRLCKDGLSSELETLQKENRALSAELEEANNQVFCSVEHEVEKESLLKESLRWKREGRDLAAVNESLVKENEKLHGSLKDMNSLVATAEVCAGTELSEENNRLSSELKTLQKENRTLGAELKEAKGRVVYSVQDEIEKEKLSKESLSWKREKQELSTVNESLEKENKKLHESLNEVTILVATAEDFARRLSEENDSLKDVQQYYEQQLHEINIVREANQYLKEEIRIVTTERTEAYDTHKVLQQEIHRLQKSLKESNIRVVKLNGDNSSLTSSFVLSKERQEMLTDKLAELTKTNESLTKDLVEKNLSLQAVQSALEMLKIEQGTIEETAIGLHAETAKLCSDTSTPPGDTTTPS